MASLKVYLTADTKKFRRGLKRANYKLKKFGGAVKKYSLMAGAALAGLAVKSVQAFGVQEDAENALRAALESNGDAVMSLMPKYKRLASTIQSQTRHGDEYVLNLMAQIRNLGVLPGKLEETTKGAIGLAKALQLDANSAARYAALAMKGEYTILQRYVPALRTATTEQEKHNIVTNMMAKGYQQAQEAATTTAGRIEQLYNAGGDVMEGLGKVVAMTANIQAGAEGGTGALAKMAANLKRDAGEIAFSFQSVAIDIRSAAKQSINAAETILKSRTKYQRETGKRIAKATGLYKLAQTAETAKMAREQIPSKSDGPIADPGTMARRLQFMYRQMTIKSPESEPAAGGVSLTGQIGKIEAARMRRQQELAGKYREQVDVEGQGKRDSATQEKQLKENEKQTRALEGMWKALEAGGEATFP